MLRAILTSPPRHQTCHFALCLLDISTGFQPADHRQEVGTTTTGIGWIELERHEELDLIVASRRERKLRRHHTDHSGCGGVHLNLFADDVTCATETFLPETVRNDRDSWSIIAIFLFSEVAAKFRRHSQHVDQAARDSGGGDSQWLTFSADVLTARRPRAD